MLCKCHLFAVGLVGLLAAVGSSAGTVVDPDSTGLMYRVRTLASEAMAGRGNGTTEALAAADSIAIWFANAGLCPVPSENGWFQDFPLFGDDEPAGIGRNVLGWLPGAGALAKRVLIIGAHYDHLGVKVADDGETVIGIYYGAEDNASGVSVLVEVARQLAAGPGCKQRSCLFVAFAGEEVGLQGSSWLVEHPVWPPGAADLMLNLDSVGRLRDDRLYVGGLGSSPVLRALVTDVNAAHGLRLELSDSGWDASDHVSFNVAGIPVLFLFTGPHPQYHSIEDRWELVSSDGLVRVASYAGDAAVTVLCHPGAFPYAAQVELPSRDPGTRGRERAWLGTIPDFVEGVDGVCLAGVMPESPAEESGLQAGDVLVQLGDHAIASLQDLTVALQENLPGQSIDVVVERGGGRQSFLVTLRNRPQ